MTTGPDSIRQTPSGFVALWTALGTLIVGGILLSASTLLVGLVLLTTWIACRWLAKRNLQGLKAARPLPSRSWVNRSFAVEGTLSIRRQRGSAARELHFLDPLAVSRTPLIPRIREGETIARSYTARCSRRGLVRTAGWSAVSHWPFGWFETRTSGSFRHGRGQAAIRVLPDPFLPAPLQDRVDGLLLSHAPWSGSPDPSAEFRFLREYQNGDPVRRIHWPASLKHGDLFVREPDPPRPLPSRYGILLHSFSPSGELVTPESFEMILRIVAGLLYRFREAGIEIALQSFPRPPATLRFREDFDREIDALATARRSPFSSLSPLQEALREFPACDERFVLSDCDRRFWEGMLVSETAGNFHCVDARSLSYHSKPLRAPVGARNPLHTQTTVS